MDYPLVIRLRQAAALLFWAAVLVLVVVPVTLRVLRAAYLALGSAGPLVVAKLAVYTAASLWASSKPYDVRSGTNGITHGATATQLVAAVLAGEPLSAVTDKAAEEATRLATNQAAASTADG